MMPLCLLDSYILDKIRKAEFSEEPFRHIEINNLIKDDDFNKIVKITYACGCKKFGTDTHRNFVESETVKCMTCREA